MGWSKWGMGPGRGFPPEEKLKARAMLWAGVPSKVVQAEFGISHNLVWKVMSEAGGMPVVWPGRSCRHLSLADREEISRGLANEMSMAAIGRMLGRSTATISREIKRNGGVGVYRAVAADRATCERAKRPRPTKFVKNPVLAMVVTNWLELNWSPEQICGRLHDDHPDDASMRVVPETVYQALFVQSRGGLNKELTKHLRTHRKRRMPHQVTARNGRGHIVGMVSIADRPVEIEDRAVPGHWEGDLIIGAAGKSQSGTLVERTTGLLMLIQLPDDRTAPTVSAALQRRIITLPAQACRSITWDQGREMSAHASFTIATDIPVYFCDPHSPWQRGSNENTNGLIRQYLPHGTDLSGLSQANLDDIAAEINNRPRKRHKWKTPLEMFNQLALH